MTKLNSKKRKVSQRGNKTHLAGGAGNPKGRETQDDRNSWTPAVNRSTQEVADVRRETRIETQNVTREMIKVIQIQ